MKPKLNNIKNNIIKLSIILGLSISLTTVLQLQKPFAVFAANVKGTDAIDGGGGGGGEGNGDGKSDNTDLNEHDSGNYPSYGKTGWLVYVTNKNGALCSPVALVPSAGNLPSGYFSGCLTSRIGNQYPSIITSRAAEWGAPFTDGGSGRGAIIKEELATGTNYNGTDKNWKYVIGTYLGQDIIDKIEEDPESYYLVLEDVAWHAVFSGSFAGQNVIASSSGWARFETFTGMDPIGDNYTGWCDNQRLQISCHLNLQWPGLPSPPTVFGRLTTDEIMSAGYGMIAVRLTDDEGIHTFWAPNQPAPGEPSPPQDNDPPRDGIYNIVKGYYEENLTTNVKTPVAVTSRLETCSTIIIGAEPGWEMIRWDISSQTNTGLDPTNWNPPATISKKGKQPETVKLKDKERCVYVLFRKVTQEEVEEEDYHYVIKESQLARRIYFSEPDNDLPEAIESYEFTWKIDAHDPSSCPGHGYSYTDSCKDTDSDGDGIDDSCGGHSNTAYCGDFEWKSPEGKDLKLSIFNESWEDYPDILANKTSFKGIEVKEGGNITKHYYKNDAKFNRTSAEEDEEYINSGWDYVCFIMRGKDKLTLAQWVNDGGGVSSLVNTANSDLDGISASGFANGNTPSGTRQLQEYYDRFSANFVNEEENGVDLKTKWGPSSGSGYGTCDTNTKEAYLTNPLAINNIRVKVETYSGDPAGGTADASINQSNMILGTSPHKSGRMVQSGSTVTFYPYIQMRYDTLAIKNNKAFVLGQYQRSITPNDYAEIEWTERGPNNPNLTIFSSQWSTHATATRDKGSENVLPGGARIGLLIKPADRQEVIARTFQCIIEGTGETQVINTGGSYGSLTRDNAIAEHQGFVGTVMYALEETNVQQYTDKNGGASTAFNGIKVDPGSDVSSLGIKAENNGQLVKNASTEDKYYFRDEGASTGTNEGDLDVEELGTETHTYTFFTNTKGELRMTTDQTIISSDGDGELVLSKGQDPSSVSGKAKEIDDRTYVVRKLAQAVESNTGADTGNGGGYYKVDEPSWAPDGTWYNEAFDGITVIEQTTKLNVGYINPPQRESIFDPKIIPKSESQSNILSGVYFINQYKTKDYSQAYGSTYTIGTFKDKNVIMDKLDMLFFSRPFWTTNITTQDLR